MIHAIDQYGTRLVLEGSHPRKELLDELGACHADKMYVDKTDGRTVHIGYIVRGSWWRFYTVEPWEVRA